ncbi:uncharacterized protein LOC100499164 [Nasonia vitripennis]|uniref:Uncharacterized protein n=1 Tax=Nasonia vitripennis TaxID=7425 RepID=A0A7M6UPX9_NASVI|nr:uncharacterized protein LOC100499164 [Nasonia vitripennis]
MEIAKKMKILSKLLEKFLCYNLHKNGRKVLWFATMTMVLDVIEDYSPLRGFKYARLDGAFEVHEKEEIFPEKDISNFLLVNTLFGTGTYIYTRKHVRQSSSCYRILYSVTGALLLSFGSVLIWSVLRSIIPANQVLFTVTGISTSIAITSTGKKYLTDIDAMLHSKNE